MTSAYSDSGPVMLMLQSASSSLVASTPEELTSGGKHVFASAHEELIVVRRRLKWIECVPTIGSWVGFERPVRSITLDSELQLERGDLLVIFSDAITDALDENGRSFGIDRLCSAIEETQDETPETVRDHVLSVVHKWMKTPADDLSLVVIRYLGRD